MKNKKLILIGGVILLAVAGYVTLSPSSDNTSMASEAMDSDEAAMDSQAGMDGSVAPDSEDMGDNSMDGDQGQSDEDMTAPEDKMDMGGDEEQETDE